MFVQCLCIQHLHLDTIPFHALGHFTFFCWDKWKFHGNTSPVCHWILTELLYRCVHGCICIQAFLGNLFLCLTNFTLKNFSGLFIFQTFPNCLYIFIGLVKDSNQNPACTFFLSHQTYKNCILKGKEQFEISLGSYRIVALSVPGSMQTFEVSELSASDREYTVI